MSVHAGSDIVTNGMVLCVDAGNTNSYSGSGTTWTDITQNGRNCTLNNSPTFDSDGFISFDGTNDYGSFSSEYSFNTGGGTDYTFEVWFKMRTLPTAEYAANGHIWGGENGNDLVIYLNPASGGTSRGIMVYDDSRYNTAHFTTAGFSANTWAQWLITGDGTNHTVTHYINGELDRGPTSVVASQQVRPWGGTRFAYDSRWSTYSTLDLAIARQYNRALSAAEAKQNFAAQKGRFNL